MSGKNFGKLMMMRDSVKENPQHSRKGYQPDYRDMRDYGDEPRNRRYPDTASRTKHTERGMMDDQYDDDYDWPVERTERTPLLAGGTFWMNRAEPAKRHARGRYGEEQMGRYDQEHMAEPFNEATATEWAKTMIYEDPAVRGPKWTPDQVRPIAEQKGIPANGEKFWQFYAMMNAMYADYYKVAEKFGANTTDFYACMAKAFMDDKDAVDNKTEMYKMYVVK